MSHRGMLLLIAAGACGRAGFDAVPADAREPPGFCATATFSNPRASSFVDDFTAPFTDRWGTIPPPPGPQCVQQIGSELVATPSNTTSQFCYAFTPGDVHLSCDSIFVRVPEVTSPVLRAQTFIYVTSLVDNAGLNVIVEAGGFQMGTHPDRLVFAPFDPQLDVWWRLTELDGETAFETSADGLAWRELMRVPTDTSLDHVAISIGAGTYDVVPPSPGQARFRCYNEPPPCN